jgi:uncharacterized protein
MKKRQEGTILFFLLSFLWTWAFYFAIVGMGLNPYQGTGMVLLILGGCSPTFVGLILAMATYPTEQRREYFKRIYQTRRIRLFWWLFIVEVMPMITVLSVVLDMATGGSLPGMIKMKAIAENPLVWFPLILLSFLSGPFSEELGWRGFALDPLLNAFGFTKGSVLLGLIWGVWHLPLYFMPQTWHGTMGFQFTGFWMFVLFSMGLSLIMSWVYIHTNRSILAAMLMHLSSNFSGQLLEPFSPKVELIRELIVILVGIAIAIYMITTKKDASAAYAATVNEVEDDPPFVQALSA